MTLAGLERIAIATWTVLILSASLNMIAIPYLHWVATLPLLILVTFNTRLSRADFSLPRGMAICGVLLIVSVLIVSLVDFQTLYDITQAGKLSVILLVVLPLLTSNRLRREALWTGAEAAVYLNLALIVGGLTVASALFGLQGLARFGTYVASPGALWRVGAIGLAAAAIVGGSDSKLAVLRGWLCGIVSVVLIALDGSRTGALVLALALLVYLPGCVRKVMKRPVLLASAIVGLVSLITALVLIRSYADDEAKFGVVSRLQSALSLSGNVSAENLDTTRYNMYRTVLEEIEEHPILGIGMGRTTAETAVGSMVVHCSFLQVWSDVGALGFISYSALFLMPAWMALQRKRQVTPTFPARARQSVYLTFGWIVAGFFHPISTELSEWIWLILAMALIANCPTKGELGSSFCQLTFFRDEPQCA